MGGRPHVLRQVDRPLQNMELVVSCSRLLPTGLLISCFRATGITTDVVERMENDLKRDVRREVRTGNGRILLHDELEHVPGQFTLTPQWETLSVDDIMTPRVSADGVQLMNGRLTFPVPKDVFELVIREGYKVNVNSALEFKLLIGQIFLG